MLAQPILVSLLATTSTLVAGVSVGDENADSGQKIINPQIDLDVAPSPKGNCLAINATPYLCPQKDPYGTWCEHRPKDIWPPVHDTYAVMSTIFGFQAPVNTRLCPISKCAPTCLCREELLKRLTFLLFAEDTNDHESADEQNAFAGGEKDEL